MTELPDLDRLIEAVAGNAISEDPLDRLAAAAAARDELDGLTEALLDHFIEAARQSGCSWSQIGNVLGVSKQAAQQRHTTPESRARQLLGRFSGRLREGGHFARFRAGARSSMLLAQDAARRLGHNYVGTEHLLLGLLAEGEGVAARTLAELGVTQAAAEAAVVEVIGCGQEEVTGHIPFTPRSKKVLEVSLREALKLGHNYIGTRHILLGLLSEGDGVAAQVLSGLGVDYGGARACIERLDDDDDA